MMCSIRTDALVSEGTGRVRPEVRAPPPRAHTRNGGPAGSAAARRPPPAERKTAVAGPSSRCLRSADATPRPAALRRAVQQCARSAEHRRLPLLARLSGCGGLRSQPVAVGLYVVETTAACSWRVGVWVCVCAARLLTKFMAAKKAEKARGKGREDRGKGRSGGGWSYLKEGSHGGESGRVLFTICLPPGRGRRRRLAEESW